MESINYYLAVFTEFIWGPPILILLLGGGLFFTFYCRFIPFRYLIHGFKILLGKMDNTNDPGQISHFQALSSALASTVGMGNISGVAIAIHTGGPGALFWMWVSAIVGMSTKFFTCTLAILYRGHDEDGEVQGGPMYVISEGMSSKYKPLAYFFSIAGIFGCLALFQANQLTQIVIEQLFIHNLFVQSNLMFSKFLIGIFISLIVSTVIFGGIKRIGMVASKLVPLMVVIYLLCGFYIIITNFFGVDDIIVLIMKDAFTGDAVLGGSLGSVIIMGIRRAAFSNEAGIGTESMAHGAAMTKEPVREGLVAMIGPFIDTIIVCTITGFSILLTDVWSNNALNGISMTSKAFSTAMPMIGQPILILIVFIFSITTMIGYSYYGSKCAAFIFGNRSKLYYRIFYIVSIIIASIISLDIVINFVDGMFALMAFPTMISTIILAPRVMSEARIYFSKIN
jgi:AGCS family alanine or glycine:cation symporter